MWNKYHFLTLVTQYRRYSLIVCKYIIKFSTCRGGHGFELIKFIYNFINLQVAAVLLRTENTFGETILWYKTILCICITFFSLVLCTYLVGYVSE